MFNSLSITLYNAILFFPIVTFVLNQDISLEVALRSDWSAKLYYDAVNNSNFNRRTVGWWLVRAFLQAVGVFGVAVLTAGPHYISANGQPSDLETLGLLAFF